MINFNFFKNAQTCIYLPQLAQTYIAIKETCDELYLCNHMFLDYDQLLCRKNRRIAQIFTDLGSLAQTCQTCMTIEKGDNNDNTTNPESLLLSCTGL